MKTLDRYIVRSFLYATLLWLIVFMVLRITAHLFANMDEFAEQQLPFGEMLGVIGQYYIYRVLVYFTELGGVIVVAAAAFTLAMMNRTNELLAILASGVSLRRVILPIVICSLAMSGLILLDREFVIPRFKSKLVLDPDNPGGESRLSVRGLTDGRNTVWYAPYYDPKTNRLNNAVVAIRGPAYEPQSLLFASWGRPVEGEQAWEFYGAKLGGRAPGRPAWEAYPTTDRIYTSIGPKAIFLDATEDADSNVPVAEGKTLASPVLIRDESYNMQLRAEELLLAVDANNGQVDVTAAGPLENPRFTFYTEDGREAATFQATRAVWKRDPQRQEGYWVLERGRAVLPTDLAIDDVLLRQTHQWMSYMSSDEIDRLLALDRVPDRNAAKLAKYTRYTEPLNNLIMLLLGLPFILSRERNIKASATLSLLTVGSFYAFIYVSRQMGLPAMLGAWLPILLFGPVAAVMVDSIKT